MVAVLKMPKVIEKPSDRRIFPRKEMRGEAAGMRIDHTITALQRPKLELSLRDISYGGCSALTNQPLEPGERLSILFPPQGIAAAWDASGRVIRCEPSAMGYRIAVQFEPALAA
jgi:hypothetical protein